MDAYIFDHVRTPRGRGKPDGSLHEVTPVWLASRPLVALAERNRLRGAAVEDVVMGCVGPVGEQGGNIARTAVLAADWDQGVPGISIDRACGSGLEAVAMAAAKVMSGQADLAVGGGVESMSRVPLGSSGGAWALDPQMAFKTYFVMQGISADLLASLHGQSRRDVDAYAAESRRGAPMSRKMLSTAAVSVGATIAPTRKASSSNSCHSADSTVTPSAVMKGKRLAPTTAQHSTTAKMAITRIGQISSIVRRRSTCRCPRRTPGPRRRRGRRRRSCRCRR
jgi:hypothetical protein